MKMTSYISSKFNNFLSRIHDKYTMEYVVTQMEKAFLDNYLISSSFEDLELEKVNLLRRRTQFMIVFVLVLVVPKYLIHTITLSLPDKETRSYYQFHSLDYLECLGYTGRTLNAGMMFSTLMATSFSLTLMRFEIQGKLECISHYKRLREKKLLIPMVIKYMITNIAIKMSSFMVSIVFIGGLVVFHLKYNSILHTCLASLVCLTCCLHVFFMASRFFLVPMLLTMESDYFVFKLKAFMEMIDYKYFNLSSPEAYNVLREFEFLSCELLTHNRVIKYLTRDLVLGCCPTVSIVLTFFVLDMPFFLKAFLGITGVFIILFALMCEFLVGQVHSEVSKVYLLMNSVMARNQNSNDIDIRIILRHQIKRLVSPTQPIGISFGDGNSFKKSDAVSVLSTTLSLTLMVLESTFK